jgi:hypothetical protein
MRKGETDAAAFLARCSSPAPETAFRSVEEAYLSSTGEVTPEFFSAPEFLNGVALPPWSGSPLDFVYKNREILESTIVSSRLDEWARAVFQITLPPRVTFKRAPVTTRTVALPRKPRAVFFSTYQAWFVDTHGTISCEDLRGRSDRADARSDKIPPDVVCLTADGPLFCYVATSNPTKIVISDDAPPCTSIKSSAPIIAADCSSGLLAWVNGESTLSVHVMARRAKRFAIRVSSAPITCVCCAAAFHVVICGSRDGELSVCAIGSAAFVRAIPVGGRPLRIIVTPAWGFVVVCVREALRDGFRFALAAFTINGEPMWRRPSEAVVRQWTVWASRAGFDFIAFCDVEDRLFVWEVYRPGAEPIAEFQAPIIGLHFLECEEAIVVVFESGKVEFVRLCE